MHGPQMLYSDHLMKREKVNRVNSLPGFLLFMLIMPVLRSGRKKSCNKDFVMSVDVIYF